MLNVFSPQILKMKHWIVLIKSQKKKTLESFSFLNITAHIKIIYFFEDLKMYLEKNSKKFCIAVKTLPFIS